MKYVRAVKVFFMRLAVYLYLSCIYRYWSRLYRFIWERKYENVTWKPFVSWSGLVRDIRRLQYKADGPKQLWDAISYPSKVMAAINSEDLGDDDVGDCDEFAIYLTDVLKRSLSGYNCTDPYYPPRFPESDSLRLVDARFLTVVWTEPGGSNGHNVCLLDWFQPSTYNDLYSYMDYGYPSRPRASVSQIVDQVIEDYSGDFGAVCLGWAIHDQDLNLLEVHWR